MNSYLYFSFKPKMLFLLLTTFSFIIINDAASYRSNTLQFGSNIFISDTNGVIKCDTLECPNGSTKCSVWTTSSDDLTILTTTRQCFDENDTVLEDKNTTASNLSGEKTNIYSEMDKGSVIQCTQCIGSTPKEIKDNQIKQSIAFTNHMNNWSHNFTNRMANLGSRIMDNVFRQFY